ncbi:MAG: HD domain-containing protein, partial [Acidobacteriota bacterium]
ARRRFESEGNAPRALEELTGQIDQIVADASDRFLAGKRVAVLAIGGYGRKELFPESDVDLLLVHSGGQRERQQRSIKDMLHHLWDLGLHLGQQVWCQKELEALRMEPVEFILALLDARCVAGEQKLCQTSLKSIIPAFLESHRTQLAGRLVELTAKRHDSFNNTVYQLEPDLKQSPGGLRDYHTGVWLRRLRGEQAFLASSEEDLEAAYRFIRKLRLIVHWICGRKQDRLTHRLQDEVARRAGFSQASSSSAVESLMSNYFLNAHLIVNFCRRNLSAASSPPASAKIEVEQEAFDSADEVLELFLSSVQQHAPLGDSARDTVVRSLSAFSRTLQSESIAERVRSLFVPRPGLYRTLSEMYELGVLELLFPEFSGIKERVIRDFYHCYTVDEHSLLAIRNIEDLAGKNSRAEGRFANLLEEARQPELLTLALLLHDVGKSREGNHAQRSARRTAQALRRLGFDGEEIDRTAALVRDHLAMSNVIFRRDLDDPRQVERFADRVQGVEQLRLLCLLTYADIGAVGPGILSSWKKDLLFQLYVAAYNHLRRGFGARRISSQSISKSLLESLPEGLGRKGFARFLKGFPRRYLTSTAPSEICQHYQLAAGLDEDPVQVRLSDRGEHHELCVLTPDRTRLFAKIVGCLTFLDMNILRGRGFSNAQGLVLDLFQFTDTRQAFRKNPEEICRFEELLHDVVQDRVSIAQLLQRKESNPLRPDLPQVVKPVAYFGEEEESADYSILEVVAPDSIGLLYSIGRRIAALDCEIELLLISTEGSRAVDVFYLSRHGRRLSPDLRKRLAARILEAIDGRTS